MKINKLNIRFVLNSARTKSDGTTILFCRITYKSVRHQFSTGVSIISKQWNSKNQVLKPRNNQNEFNSSQLRIIKDKINQVFLTLQSHGKDFDVNDIYNLYRGDDKNVKPTVLQIFQNHNNKIEKLIGKDYVLPTLWKFNQSKNLLEEFIQFQYSRKDFKFEDLDLKFIQAYEYYLKTEKNLALATVNKAIQRFRKIIKIALSEGYLNRDPFVEYKVNRAKTKIIFLSTDELHTLENYRFAQSRLNFIKDLFIFCCYTGLAFNEMSELRRLHIQRGFDGLNWIRIDRKKTNKELSIPVLPPAEKILESYVNECDKIFPSISNQKFNSYLKEIADILGIEKNLTHHVARKTFASTVLLYNDVPMEIVSELLGHSSMKVTQESYGKVVQKKLSETMKSLASKLNK